MIRITRQEEPEGTVVTIDGDVKEADVVEIRRFRASLSGMVALNLGGITACTVEGLRVLREWLDNGARLRNATLFLRMMLESIPEPGRKQNHTPSSETA